MGCCIQCMEAFQAHNDANIAVAMNDFQKLNELSADGFIPRGDICWKFVSTIDMLEWLKKQKQIPALTKSMLKGDTIVTEKHFFIFTWLIENNFCTKEQIEMKAFKTGNIPLLQFARSNKDATKIYPVIID